VTRSVNVPPDVGLLAAPDNRVIVLTPSPDRTLEPCAAQVEYLRDDLAAGVRRLRTELGMRSVLCEGGPQILGDLLRARLVDELHLVVAPLLAGGADPKTIVSGAVLDPPVELRLLSLHESGGYLFLRYGA
jgi:riboflavin biosynthesis pyrimidine reductase